MARYQRQHSGPNLSSGTIWILGICGMAYIIYKIVSCNQAARAVNEYELREINSGKARELILDDSINKIDTAI